VAARKDKTSYNFPPYNSSITGVFLSALTSVLRVFNNSSLCVYYPISLSSKFLFSSSLLQSTLKNEDFLALDSSSNISCMSWSEVSSPAQYSFSPQNNPTAVSPLQSLPFEKPSISNPPSLNFSSNFNQFSSLITHPNPQPNLFFSSSSSPTSYSYFSLPSETQLLFLGTTSEGLIKIWDASHPLLLLSKIPDNQEMNENSPFFTKGIRDIYVDFNRWNILQIEKELIESGYLKLNKKGEIESNPLSNHSNSENSLAFISPSSIYPIANLSSLQSLSKNILLFSSLLQSSFSSSQYLVWDSWDPDKKILLKKYNKDNKKDLCFKNDFIDYEEEEEESEDMDDTFYDNVNEDIEPEEFISSDKNELEEVINKDENIDGFDGDRFDGEAKSPFSSTPESIVSAIGFSVSEKMDERNPVRNISNSKIASLKSPESKAKDFSNTEEEKIKKDISFKLQKRLIRKNRKFMRKILMDSGILKSLSAPGDEQKGSFFFLFY
jgi:hypothetical protein